MRGSVPLTSIQMRVLRVVSQEVSLEVSRSRT